MKTKKQFSSLAISITPPSYEVINLKIIFSDFHVILLKKKSIQLKISYISPASFINWIMSSCISIALIYRMSVNIVRNKCFHMNLDLEMHNFQDTSKPVFDRIFFLKDMFFYENVAQYEKKSVAHIYSIFGKVLPGRPLNFTILI